MISLRKKRFISRLLPILVVGVFVVSIFTLCSNGFFRSASAANLANFDPGNIISDASFYNYGSMSASSIQSFLNSKVSNCQSGYSCLKNYTANTVSKAADNYCSGYRASTQSAAQIIHGVAQSCKINPQVLLVLLQKETGLVTHTGPAAWRYKTATGMGCPDGAGATCDSQYYGLFNQLYGAARQYRIYQAKPSSFNYVAGRNNIIKWNPESSCGTSTVYIKNQATAGLYNYTPYRPNAAALAAGYGTGNSCSSYGNRNFWLYYNDWFGPTTSIYISGCTQATNTTLACVWRARDNSRGVELATASYATISNYVNGRGYQYLGMSFVARNKIAPQAGNIPVYGVSLQNGEIFMTANFTEYSALLSNTNNSDLGKLFYADPSYSNTGYPVYRLFKAATGSHVWTASSTEKSQYLSNGYVYEGIAFNSLSSVVQTKASPQGTINVYRFRDMPEGRHFWTKDVYERDQMIKAGYKYDGVGWIGVANATSGDVPIYRLYSPTMKKHLFTKDSHEKDVLNATSSWVYEGVAFTAKSAGKPVYRLYRPSNAAHFYTSDAYERSILIKSGVFRDEGIAWYQPT